MIEPEKGHLQKNTGNIMLSGEGPNYFPLNSETRKDLKKPQMTDPHADRRLIGKEALKHSI